MKKFIRNSSLIIITLLTVLVGISSASAISCSETDLPCKSTAQGDWIASGTYKSGVSTTMTKTAYRGYLSSFNLALYKNDKPYSAKNYNYYSYSDSFGNTDYCLDADKSSVKNLFIHRFLLDNYRDSKNVYLHDVAVMEVLTSVGQPAPKTDENIATSIAIRTLNHVFGLSQDFERTNKSDSWEAGGVYNKAYMGLAYKWVVGDEHYPEVKTAYDTLSSKLASESFFRDSSTLANFKDWRFAGINGGSTLQRARELFNAGILAASKAADTNGNAVIENGLSGEILNNGIQKETDAIGERVYLDMKFTFKLKNFTNDGKSEFKIDNLVYNDGADKVGAISEPKVIYVGDDARQIICDELDGSTSGDCSNIIGKNILEGMTMVEEKNIFVIIRFEGYSSLKDSNSNTPVLNCGAQPMGWTMNYSYNDTNITNLYPDYVGSVWYGYGDNGQKLNTVQRYVSVTKASGEQEKGKKEELTGEVILKEECDCTSLREACIATDNLDSDECKEFFAAGCSECDELKVECEVGNNQTACKTYEETCEFTCDTFVDTYECCDADNLIVSTEDDKEVSILGPGPDNKDADNIKACFVNMVDNQKKDETNGYSNIAGVKDQKDNSYTSSDLANNKYCSVSCKEDYIMTMPTAKMVNAGRYFTFRAKVEGTKTCYTNTIDRNQYNKDMVEVQTNLIDTYNEYLKWTTALKNIKSDNCKYTNSVKTSCENPPCGCRSSCGCTGYFVNTSATYAKLNYSKNEATGVVTVTGTTNTNLEAFAEDGGKSGSGCPSSCTAGSEATLKSNIEKKITALEKKLTEYTDKKNSIIKDYNGCSNWTSDINYKPNVFYDYEEDYLEKNSLTGLMDENLSSIDNKDWYCNSTVNNNGSETNKAKLTGGKYEACSNSGNNYSDTSIGYVACSTSGCKIANEKISNARYKKQTSKITANYKPKTLFYNIYPSGEITINKDTPNAKPLENKLPVSLATKRGIYKYTVNVENLGEFYAVNDKNNLGRYVGAKTAIVDPKTLVYACAYLVNITTTDGWVCDFDDECTDDCISNCVGPGCEDDDNYCDGEDCIAECVGVGCIYDKDAGTSITERVVSLSNLFQNGTKAYNWNKEVNEKAKETVTAIEEKGNKAYDEKPILSLTINPSTARSIKKYNEENENNGGYSNKTMSCYKLGAFENVACYSTFIDDLLDDKYGKNIINNDSKISNSSYRTGTDVKNATSKDGYFKMWSGSISEKSMVGPAWK